MYKKMMTAVLALVFGLSLAIAQNAPYVGAWEAKNKFDDITQAQMDVLRTKKILFASRSFGLNLRNGLQLLANQDSKWNMLNSYNRWDVFGAGSDLSIIPSTAFDSYNFVHFLATYWPHTQRVAEVEQLVTTSPWNFSGEADVVFIYFHTALASAFSTYSAKMDSMQAAYPNIKFIYSCAGYMDYTHSGDNANSDAFNALVKAKYKGNAPLYDLAAILSDDGRCGSAYCPEYSFDPAGVHPNNDAGEIQMAQGFILVLKEAFFGFAASCTSAAAPTVPAGLAGTPLSTTSIKLDWTASTHADCGVKQYNIMRDDVQIGTSYNTTFTDNGLSEGTSYDYQVAAVSIADVASAYCSKVSVSTQSDTDPPAITQVNDTGDPVSVTIYFSEPLDQTSAETAGNYSINNGITVHAASLSGSEVTLTTDSLTAAVLYTVSVTGVKDASAAGNTIAAGAQGTFYYTPTASTGDAVVHFAFDGNLDETTSSGITASWNGTSHYTSGKYGQGLSFSTANTDDYVLMNHHAALDGYDAMSISIWAKRATASTGGQVFKKHVVYDLKLSSTGVSGYFFNDSTDQCGFGGTADNQDTEWHHYCLSYDGSMITVYVDAEVVATKAMTGAVASEPSRKIYFGKDPWGDAFNGDLDEFLVFDRALDSADVAALASGGLSVNTDSIAVQAILDWNNVKRNVNNVAKYDSSIMRITELNLQEAGISYIGPEIGQLTELTYMHCYGDRTLGYALLDSVSGEIGKCTKLNELLLNQNDLTALPDEITSLTSLTIFSAGDNCLCSVTDPVKTWLDTYDPDWAATQNCSSAVAFSGRGSKTGERFMVTRMPGKVIISRNAANGPIQADIYSLNGEKVYSIQSCCAETMEWHTSAFGSGMYVLDIRAGNVQMKRKVIITQQ